MLKHMRISVVALAALSLLLAAAFPASAAKREKIVWRVGTLAPKGIGWAKQVEDILYPAVAEGSDDNLRLKIFWGGVLGNDAETIKNMQIGRLQGAGLNAQGATLACPEFSVLKLPFLFNNYDEVDFVRPRMIASFDYYFAQNGMKLLLWVDQDFDQLYSAVSPMTSLESFKKTTFVDWYGRMDEAVFSALGAKSLPTKVSDISKVLRTGEADSVIAPAIWMVGSQLYSVVHYVNPMKMSYSPAAIVVALDAWNDLPKDYQTRLWNMREDLIARFCSGTRTDNARCLNAMLEYGVKDEGITPANLAAIKKQAMTVYGELADEVYPLGLLQEMLRYLAEYRGESVPAVLADIRPAAERPAAAQPKKQDEAKQKSWDKRISNIRAVQTKLKGLGLYPGAIDGIPGPMTYGGIKKYQKANNLPQTGAIDEDLLSSMGIE